MKVDEEGGAEEQQRQRRLKDAFNRRRPTRRRRRGKGRKSNARRRRKSVVVVIIDAATTSTMFGMDDGPGARERVEPQGVASGGQRSVRRHICIVSMEWGERERAVSVRGEGGVVEQRESGCVLNIQAVG